VMEHFADKESEYFLKGIELLVHRCEKCIEIKGDYIEKQQSCFISVTLKSWSGRKLLDPTKVGSCHHSMACPQVADEGTASSRLFPSPFPQFFGGCQGIPRNNGHGPHSRQHGSFNQVSEFCRDSNVRLYQSGFKFQKACQPK